MARCELKAEDLLNYFRFMSSEAIALSMPKNDLILVYEYLMKCQECWNDYIFLKEEKKRNADSGFLPGFHPDWELLSRNEKTLEALFRN